jgi:penicillin-binding protein 2
MTVTTAIQQSCDIFFYELAKRMGIDRIDETAHKLGLGAPTGLELPGERSGLIPTKAWKRATFGHPWQQGETLITGIGQGYLLLTPLQLCMQAARIASGKAVTPRITRYIGAHEQQRPPMPALPFSPDTFKAVHQGMNMAVNEPGGTAYWRRITEPGFEMAGKTGTAQVRRITKEERARGETRTNKLPWKYREHELFIAFAPVHKPRYACSVVIEHGAAIAPFHIEVARDILLFTQKRDPAGLTPAWPVATAHRPNRA